MARPAAQPAEVGPRSTERFREIFSAESSYVWNVLRRLGVRGADVQDLAHEVFVILYRHLHDATFDATRPLRPWLAATAFRVASVHRRAAIERREVLDGEVVAAAVDERADPERLVAAERDRALVLRALEAIEPERRVVFILHDIDEQPMNVVAEALAIPLNTGYSRLRLSRDEFRAAVLRLRPELDRRPSATRAVGTRGRR
ncbi:MAG TPA: sigma-70 family RNA polymerase sigma factor [Minicystis sp.]|nr:sigma-70 family RNA polymerase sigma factor [Minicystis sp.]